MVPSCICRLNQLSQIRAIFAKSVMSTEIYYLKLINEKQSESDFDQKIYISADLHCDRLAAVRVFTYWSRVFTKTKIFVFYRFWLSR